MTKKRTIEEFEELANKVHNGKYTYHQDYMNNKKPILIKCSIH